MNRLFALATMCLVVIACDKKEAPASADSARPSAPEVTAPPAPVAAAAPIVEVDTLPVEEDFEADAEKDLTVANLNAKLDDLEKEISAP